MLFAWHEDKAVSNRRKHRVSLADAAQVFNDPFAVAGHGRIESGERRWQIVGMIAGLIVVVVAYASEESEEDEIIRLISARQATRRERIHYEQNRQKNTQ